ncbi:MAG: MBL fold metallo-hydrolase [Actinobacteria bacterium]|nr:MBL fold metallo-hydrolase [Actinomycetota bacterium]
MHIETITVGPLMVNSYLVVCENTNEAVVIDPGEEEDKILQRIGEMGARVKYILLTHGHVDHLGAVAEVQTATGAEICIHKNDVPFVENAAVQASFFDLRIPAPFKINHYVKDGDELKVGESIFRVLETPGHSPGGVCYLCGDFLFSGDTLFQQSIGRTDLPGGAHRQLLDSIAKKLMILPERTKVYPGHGPATTIGDEKRLNPFLVL